MKKLCCLLLAMLFCLSTVTALAAFVPEATTNLPEIPRRPDTPMVVRLQEDADAVTITLDQALPADALITALALDTDYRVLLLGATTGENNTYTADGLPEGAQWLGFEISWTSSIGPAKARYDAIGGLDYTVWFDGDGNEYYFDSQGLFYEIALRSSTVRVRFNEGGQRTSYGYEAAENMIVWFDMTGALISASYDDGEYSLDWNPADNWYVRTLSGRIKVRADISPWGAQPLLPAEEAPETETPEVLWYYANTINLAGIPLQEISTDLPDKWYNMIPVDLTVEGRQTYYLTISNVRFIGRCHVDVWDGEVTVRYSLLDNREIELVSEYGCWFTSLEQITSQSIESTENGFAFGKPVSIAEDLGGADMGLLFIRCTANYRQPFDDGTEMVRYWRDLPEWKEFRQELQELLPLVEK